MKRFYDIATGTVQTEAALRWRGMPTNDKHILSLAGKVEIQDAEIPNHLPIVQTYMGSDLIYSEETGTCIQHYEVADACTLDVAITRLKDKVKEIRQQFENGGIIIEGTGTALDSTRTDGQMVHNAYVLASLLKPDVLIDFKATNQWVTLTLDTLRELFNIHSAHVEKCFTREKQICELLDTAETIQAAVDIFTTETTQGWPTYAD